MIILFHLYSAFLNQSLFKSINYIFCPHQETLAPPYNGPQHCTYEITRLLRPDESLTLCPSTILAMEGGVEDASATSDSLSPAAVEGSSGTLSEEGAEVEGATLPLSGSSSSSSSSSSCSCMISMKEPVELGENEDCSQVVAASMAGVCSCGSGEREDRDGERERERDGGSGRDKVVESAAAGVGGGGLVGGREGGGPEESPLCQNCCPEEGLLGCADCTELRASQDLYLDYSSLPEKEPMSEARCSGDSSHAGPQGTMGPVDRLNEPRCCSIESTTAPALSSVSANDQGISLSCSAELKLSDPDVDAEYQAHCSETALTSGGQQPLGCSVIQCQALACLTLSSIGKKHVSDDSLGLLDQTAPQ